jgi:hypothetical protein
MKLPSLGICAILISAFALIITANKESIINQVRIIQHGKCVITKSNANVNGISGGVMTHYTGGCTFTNYTADK